MANQNVELFNKTCAWVWPDITSITERPGLKWQCSHSLEHDGGKGAFRDRLRTLKAKLQRAFSLPSHTSRGPRAHPWTSRPNRQAPPYYAALPYNPTQVGRPSGLGVRPLWRQDPPLRAWNWEVLGRGLGANLAGQFGVPGPKVWSNKESSWLRGTLHPLGAGLELGQGGGRGALLSRPKGGTDRLDRSYE